MPKSQYLDPVRMREPSTISFKDIEVNTYQKTVSDELNNFTKEEFMRIYHDMAMIREFETMINLIKTTGEYHGIPYNHPGPAHLSMGQEASAVGQAYTLTIEDHIFGSHRSHGEILAKGMSAINQLSDDELMKIMREFFDGEVLRIVEGRGQSSVKELALDFLIYGTMAEIFARRTGFNRGLGGSMHAFFTPFGIYPNNAIVGGSGTIAAGAALYNRVNHKKGIVVANIGDGSLGRGPVLEALNFACMDQIKKLWDESLGGGLPLIFNVFNNQYGMGGQTNGETMGYEVAARLGVGFAANQMHAERVDGFNPLAVIDAMRRKKEIALKGEGPVLLDVLTYRFAGHSPSDSSSYRTKEEIQAWQEYDPLKTFRAQLVLAGVATEAECDAVLESVAAVAEKNLRLAIDDTVSPHINPVDIEDLMYSDEKVDAFDDRPAEVLAPIEECPRVQAIAKKERYGYDKDGKLVSKNKVYQLRDGLFEAIIDRFYKDPTLVAYGEDNRDWGGAFAVYRGLTEVIPYHRFFNAPISESAIVGSAVGYAMCGGRALVELMYCDFLGCAGDEIFNQMAKWQAMSADVLKMPLVLRVSVGSKYGAQHSQDWSALTAHIPGLKVVFPATPYDAKGLMASALHGTDPVIFFESQRLYDYGELFHEGGVPEGYYEIEIGKPDIKVAGTDVTILSIGSTLYRVMDAVKELKDKHGISAEVIDARSLVPFDYDLVVESVKKTGKIIITGDSCARNSFMSELARNISELCFDYLDAPPVVVGAKNWITPAHELEDAFFPQASWIIDAINQKLIPLEGHTDTVNFSKVEQLRTAKKGV
ncbi:MAG: dehydrogenase [Clostridiales bacterium]|nr:dehydrogenase [Clostridiales bacterium]MBQ2818244.1 dehydrogenase [Clostridia bacterium]